MSKILLSVLCLLTFKAQGAENKFIGDFYCLTNTICPEDMACEDPGFTVTTRNSKVVEVEGFSYLDEVEVERFYVKRGILYVSGTFQEEPFKANVKLSKVPSRFTPGSIKFGTSRPERLRCDLDE